MHRHYRASSLSCIVIIVHRHYHASGQSLSCIVIIRNRHYFASSLICIRVVTIMHHHYYASSLSCIVIIMHRGRHFHASSLSCIVIIIHRRHNSRSSPSCTVFIIILLHIIDKDDDGDDNKTVFIAACRAMLQPSAERRPRTKLGSQPRDFNVVIPFACLAACVLDTVEIGGSFIASVRYVAPGCRPPHQHWVMLLPPCPSPLRWPTPPSLTASLA